MRKKVHLKVFLKKKVVNKTQSLLLGSVAIKATQPGFLTKNQIEAARKIIARTLKKVNGRSWVKVTRFLPLTKKSKGARMGKGKGNFFCDIAPVKSGKILFELEGLSDKTQLDALVVNVSSKLPIKIRLTGL